MERMEKLLFEASVQGSVASLLLLLQEDPLILDRVTLNCYDDTPLHVASMLGHIDFVREILTRKPQLATECDSQRCLPLHIASAKGHVGIVKALVSANPETCLARDRDGRNPLHLAAIKGRDDVVKELVQAQPDAARALAQHETILHLCVKHNQLEVLKFLVETIGDHEFVNSKDADGNTILHLAVADKQIETINFLLLRTTIQVNASNTNGDTPMDVLAKGRRDAKDLQIIKSLKRTGQVPNDARSTARLGSLEDHEKPPSPSPLQRGLAKQDNWLEQKRNTLMVVASLIATMAFQAGISPPNGVWQNDDDKGHKAGSAVMADRYPGLYNVFLVCNTVGFVSTLSIILLLISGLPFFKRRFFMWILTVTMWISTTAMSLTYLVSILALTPDPLPWALTPDLMPSALAPEPMPSALTPDPMPSALAPEHTQKTFVYVAGGTVVVWIGLLSLLLVGHAIRMTYLLVVYTIRLIRTGARKLGGLTLPRRRSISSPMV